MEVGEGGASAATSTWSRRPSRILRTARRVKAGGRIEPPQPPDFAGAPSATCGPSRLSLSLGTALVTPQDRRGRCRRPSEGAPRSSMFSHACHRSDFSVSSSRKSFRGAHGAGNENGPLGRRPLTRMCEVRGRSSLSSSARGEPRSIPRTRDSARPAVPKHLPERYLTARPRALSTLGITRETPPRPSLFSESPREGIRFRGYALDPV